METDVHITHTHNANPMSESVSRHDNETHSFYLFVLIVCFAIVVLQPLAMLLVTLMAANIQG